MTDTGEKLWWTQMVPLGPVELGVYVRIPLGGSHPVYHLSPRGSQFDIDMQRFARQGGHSQTVAGVSDHHGAIRVVARVTAEPVLALV